MTSEKIADIKLVCLNMALDMLRVNGYNPTSAEVLTLAKELYVFTVN